MKKTLLTVLIVCMILSTVSVSAVTVTDNNYFSEYNVLHNRINSQQTMSTMSTNTTADSFDVVIGLDMSADMQAFDPSATYEWMEYFSVLPEQSATNTRFAVVTNELSGEFSLDPSADIAAAASLGYIEVGSAQVLLENCVSAFESTTSATKVILLATADVSNDDLLESAAEQLAENGIYMFVYLLNPYASETDCEYIYSCLNPLQLRLAISDMYLSLAEYKTASSGSSSTYAMTTGGNTGYISDYKADRHALYNGETNVVGRKFASVLNIYGCVPLYGAIDGYYYNLLTDIDTTNGFAILEAFLNKDFSATEFEVPSTSNFDHIWNEIADNSDIFVETNKLHVLEKNLKQRFPVIAIENDGKYKIVSEYTEGQYDETSFGAVFDTALYLAATAANAQIVSTELNVYTNGENENISEITKTVPGVNNTASALLYSGGTTQLYIEGTNSLPGWVAKDEIKPEYTFTIENFTDDSAINHLVAAFKTTFENGLADCYDPDPYYLLRRYVDIGNSAGLWYYEYLSKATTLGIIRGNEESEFGVKTDAEGEEAAYVTIAEFVKMAFSAAGIPQEVSTTGHWAENYMAEAREHGIIAEDIDAEAKYDENLSRAEAAHIMNQLFLENADIVQVPTMLYRYDMDKVEGSDDEKAIKWNTSVQSQASATSYEEDVFQMFMNDIMVGDGTGLHLADSLNRAEAVVLIMKPLFKLDDSFERANVKIDKQYEIGTVLTDTVEENNQKYIFFIDKENDYRINIAGCVSYIITDIFGTVQNRKSGSDGNEVYNFKNGFYIITFPGIVGNNFSLYLRAKRQENVVEFVKNSNKNFIYVNSPEYITDFDIINSDSTENYNTASEKNKLKKLYEQQNVSGEYTYYQTHLAWYGEMEEIFPEDEFYMDIDFYNPTQNTVKIKVTNLAYGMSYDVIKNYYNGTGGSFEMVVEPGKHQLLFENYNKNQGGDSFIIKDKGEHESGWARAQFIVNLFDFEVSEGFVTVSSVAAYNREHLYFEDYQENRLQIEKDIDNGEIIRRYENIENKEDVDISTLNMRFDNEKDLADKYKGFALNESAWIDVELEFVVNKGVTDSVFEIKLKDDFFGEGFANPSEPKKYSWIAAINPLHDSNQAYLTALPNSLHKFKYMDGDSEKYWLFDFYHKNSNYINDTSQTVLNQEIPEEKLEQYRSAMQNQTTNGNIHTAEAHSTGEWGTTYHYTITVSNPTSEDRVFEFCTWNCERLTIGYKKFGDINYNVCFIEKVGPDLANAYTENFSVPANTDVTFEIVTCLAAGQGGIYHLTRIQ